MWYNTRQGGMFMVDLKVSSKEYDSLSNRTKRKVFEELAHRILILHPEYLEEAKQSLTIDIIDSIKEETDNKPCLSTKEMKKIKRRLRR